MYDSQLAPVISCGAGIKFARCVNFVGVMCADFAFIAANSIWSFLCSLVIPSFICYICCVVRHLYKHLKVKVFLIATPGTCCAFPCRCCFIAVEFATRGQSKHQCEKHHRVLPRPECCSFELYKSRSARAKRTKANFNILLTTLMQCSIYPHGQNPVALPISLAQ